MERPTQSEDSLVSFDVRRTPFSLRGSWMNLSPVIGYQNISDHVHVVSHKKRITPVFELIPAADGGTWTGTPAKLTWTAPDASIELAFQDVSRIRIRTRGTALTLSTVLPTSGPMFTVDSYIDQADGSTVFTVEETGQRYRVKALGEASMTSQRLYEAAFLWDTHTPSVTLQQASTAEFVIEEVAGADTPDWNYPKFDQVVTARAEEFAQYVESIAPFGAADDAGIAHAAYVDWASTVFPSGFYRRNAMLMSKHWMDKAWSWDHCFNALAISRTPADAWDQFWVMFDQQSPTGQLPDSIAHSEIRFNYVKPPIHGLTLRSLLERLPKQPTEQELRHAYDALGAWTNWWSTTMTGPGEKLAHYYFGNDSGWDNSTMFDGFHPLQAPDLNAFLVLQMEVLSDLAARIGLPAEERSWADRSRDLLEALISQLWDGENFVTRKPGTGELRWTQSLLFTLPIVLGDRLPAEIQDALVGTIESHLTAHGLATEHPSSSEYDPDGYWRGPIWAPSTYLIWSGLRASGHEQLAATINDRFRAMCERSGFAENFDAYTGEGLRDRAYTWTASVYLLFAEEAAARRPLD